MWMTKHPCPSCGTGYGMCAQGAVHSLQCCKECSHPGRWASDPWTADDLIEMWEGQEMPEWTKQTLARLQADAPDAGVS